MDKLQNSLRNMDNHFTESKLCVENSRKLIAEFKRSALLSRTEQSPNTLRSTISPNLTKYSLREEISKSISPILIKNSPLTRSQLLDDGSITRPSLNHEKFGLYTVHLHKKRLKERFFYLWRSRLRTRTLAMLLTKRHDMEQEIHKQKIAQYAFNFIKRDVLQVCFSQWNKQVFSREVRRKRLEMQDNFSKAQESLQESLEKKLKERLDRQTSEEKARRDLMVEKITEARYRKYIRSRRRHIFLAWQIYVEDQKIDRGHKLALKEAEDENTKHREKLIRQHARKISLMGVWRILSAAMRRRRLEFFLSWKHNVSLDRVRSDQKTKMNKVYIKEINDLNDKMQKIETDSEKHIIELNKANDTKIKLLRTVALWDAHLTTVKFAAFKRLHDAHREENMESEKRRFLKEQLEVEKKHADALALLEEANGALEEKYKKSIDESAESLKAHEKQIEEMTKEFLDREQKTKDDHAQFTIEYEGMKVNYEKLMERESHFERIVKTYEESESELKKLLSERDGEITEAKESRKTSEDTESKMKIALETSEEALKELRQKYDNLVLLQEETQATSEELLGHLESSANHESSTTTQYHREGSLQYHYISDTFSFTLPFLGVIRPSPLNLALITFIIMQLYIVYTILTMPELIIHKPTTVASYYYNRFFMS
eukprot:g906.t1